jgi:hypothetical protein
MRFEKGEGECRMVKKHKLTKDSEPHKWFEALLPVKENDSQDSFVSICQWTSYANMRAVLSNDSAVLQYMEAIYTRRVQAIFCFVHSSWIESISTG